MLSLMLLSFSLLFFFFSNLILVLCICSLPSLAGLLSSDLSSQSWEETFIGQRRAGHPKYRVILVEGPLEMGADTPGRIRGGWGFPKIAISPRLKTKC
jgi:hypothetical protein